MTFRKVFVAGASGRVGNAVVRDLVAQGYEVVAGSRHPDQVREKGRQVTAVTLDFHDPVQAILPLLQGCDAVIFTAGSRGKDLLQTDLNGAVKLMTAAAQAGVRRYVQLSSAYATDQDMWEKVPALAGLMDYNISKFFSDMWLMHESGLDYTIVQPGPITDAPGTGKVVIGRTGSNSFEDVAAVLVACLGQEKTIGRVLLMSAPVGGGEASEAGEAGGMESNAAAAPMEIDQALARL